MPNLANVTVKKNDGTTDIIYTGKQPAAGSLSPAIWKGPQGTAPAHQADFRMISKSNQAGTVRRIEEGFTYPVTAIASDGSVSVVSKMTYSGTYQVPTNCSQTDINEFATQLANFLVSALHKDCIKEGYAPV